MCMHMHLVSTLGGRSRLQQQQMAGVDCLARIFHAAYFFSQSWMHVACSSTLHRQQFLIHSNA